MLLLREKADETKASNVSILIASRLKSVKQRENTAHRGD